MIDIKAMYIVLVTILIMILMAVINLRNIAKFKTAFWNIILGVNTCVVAGTFIYVFALMYKYINESEIFISEYGEFHKYLMYIGYYYAIVNIAIYILIFLKKLSIRKFKI